MKVDNLKGRVAEALVESILRQAGYTVSRLGRESQVQRLMKVGADDFAPDFLVWKRAKRATCASESDLHQLLTVEVKYRANLAGFLRRQEAAELLAKAKVQWPGLYLVIVTDDPADGRSCFQAVCVRDHVPGNGCITVDLSQLPAFDISCATVQAHEGIARALFATLRFAGRDTRCASA